MGKRVAVIGGGITGLVCAFELVRADTDVECTLIEALPHVGGNIVTLRIDDCLVDAGPDAVPVTRPDALELCRDLDLSLDGPDERAGDVLVARGHRLVHLPGGSGLPLRSLACTPLLSATGRARALLGLVLPHRPGLSVGELARRRLGREACDYLVEPIVGGLLAGDIDTLDAAAIARLWANFDSVALRDGFLSPHGGMGEIVDALVARIGPDRIVCGAPVLSLRQADARWHVDTAEREAAVADAVVIATPAHAASRMLVGTDRLLAGRLDLMRAGSVASVFIGFDLPPERPPAGYLFFPRVERRATFAATFLTTRWPGRAPPGRVVLRALVGGARAPELLDRASDERLVTLALADLRAYVDLPAPRWSHVVRFERSAPQPDVGHGARIEEILARAELFPGLFFAGGAYGPGVGLASCVAEGRRAARAVVEAQV
jgi:oxygen-dependent protoporphyrinogen oxidase